LTVRTPVPSLSRAATSSIWPTVLHLVKRVCLWTHVFKFGAKLSFKHFRVWLKLF
jgi:hypothetical protein